MARALVIGGSFGGMTAAYELRRHLGREHEVFLISREDRFVFMPSLPWVAMGWKNPDKVHFPIEGPLRRKGIRFLHGAVRRIDPEKQVVITSAGEEPYDHLVIATGSDFDFDALEGLNPSRGPNTSLLTLQHALGAMESLKRALEAEGGDMVIGNVQGASCLGPAYELAMMVDTELRRRKKRHRYNIYFLTNEPFLAHFGVGGIGASRRAFEDEFRDRDIIFETNCFIEGITPDHVELRGGVHFRHTFLNLMPSFMGVEAVRASEGLGNPRGFVPADADYRHPKYPNIFTVGVAMALSPPSPTPVPTGVPKTGNMTVNMAKRAARVIASELQGKRLEPPDDLGVLCVADAGDTAFLFNVKPVLPPRYRTFYKKGKWAHWFKVLFETYFLWKMRTGRSYLP